MSVVSLSCSHSFPSAPSSITVTFTNTALAASQASMHIWRRFTPAGKAHDCLCRPDSPAARPQRRGAQLQRRGHLQTTSQGRRNEQLLRPIRDSSAGHNREQPFRRSVLRFGRFSATDLGDLTWDKERALMCPVNRIGTVSLLIVSHHGWYQSSQSCLRRCGSPPSGHHGQRRQKGRIASNRQAD